MDYRDKDGNINPDYPRPLKARRANPYPDPRGSRSTLSRFVRKGVPSYPFYGIYIKRRTPLEVLPHRSEKKLKKQRFQIILWLSLSSGAAITLMLVVGLLVGLFGAGTGLLIGGYNYYARGLSLDREYALSFETSRIYDRNGVLLFEKQPEQGAREYIPLKDIPKSLIDATVAAEDPTFFDNQGVDFYAVARAVYINASGRGSSGASTITQQVARLLYLPPEERYQVTAERKIREMILATMITDKFTKDQILEKYLNQIYYGNMANGIQAASQGYFGKNAKDLTLAEASMLAGLPQLPSQLDPTLNYSGARDRQRYVLDQMVKNNMITQAEADSAYSYDIKSNLKDRRKKPVTMRAPHFVNYIISLFQSDEGVKQLRDDGVLINPDEWEQGGYDIYTTVDIKLVEEAQLEAQKRIADLKKQNATNAALVAMRPSTGEVLSMVGSVDFNSTEIDGQFNSAVAYRQPGSSIKPITYAAAMTKGWTAATVIADVRTNFPGAGGKPYVPLNFDGSFHGPVPVRNALGSSLNIAAVKALQFDGIPYMMDLARDMGVNFQNPPEFYGLPLTLGGGEVRLLDLTSAYTVFANQGQKIDPVTILKVARHGKTLYEWDPLKTTPRQVLSPQIAYVITNILSDNNARLLAFARSNPLVLSRPAAAKTGTTNDFKDSWTVGYTPDLAVGVWIGNNDNTQMLAVAGSVGGGFVWHDFMEKVYSDPDLSKAITTGNAPLQKDFTRPKDIVSVTVCTDSGLLPNDDPVYACPDKHTEIFPADNVPKAKSTLHQKVKVPKLVVTPSPAEGETPTTTVAAKTPLPTMSSSNYCIAGSTYPPEAVEERVFYNFPADLKEWGISQGKLPPPVQDCPPYEPPPTPTPSITDNPYQPVGPDGSPLPITGSPLPDKSPGTPAPTGNTPRITPAPTTVKPATPASKPPAPTPTKPG